MTTQSTQRCLEDLLSNKENLVIALTGRWGTGKTYLWDQVRKRSPDVKVREALSVSLFGVADIAQLKAKIVQSAIGNPVGRPALVEKLAPALLAAKKVCGGLLLGSKASALDELGLAIAAPFVLSDKVIAIDDIERKHEKLTVDEVLGFIDECVLKHGARVVLILNSDKLKDKSLWDVMREKVVDVEVRLETTPEEAFSIALAKVATPFGEALRLSCAKCELSNIRIIRKIIATCNRVLGVGSSYAAELIDRVVPPITLLSALHFKGVDGGPSIDFVLRGGTIAALVADEAVGQDESRWQELITELRIFYPDEFERQVVAALESGDFDSEALRAEIDRLSSGADRSAAQDQLSKFVLRTIWHHHLTDEELLAQAREIVAISPLLGAASLSTLHAVLLDLEGGAALTQGLVRNWIEANKDRNDFDHERDRSHTDVLPELLAAMDAEFERQHQSTSIVDIVTDMAARRSLGDRHLVGLRFTTAAAYEETIRTLDPDKLPGFMRACVHLAQNNWGKRQIAESMDRFVEACESIVASAPSSRLSKLLHRILKNAGLIERQVDGQNGGDDIVHRV